MVSCWTSCWFILWKMGKQCMVIKIDEQWQPIKIVHPWCITSSTRPWSTVSSSWIASIWYMGDTKLSFTRLVLCTIQAAPAGSYKPCNVSWHAWTWSCKLIFFETDYEPVTLIYDCLNCVFDQYFYMYIHVCQRTVFV